MSTYTDGRGKATPATVIRVLAFIVAMLLVSAATLQRSQRAFSGRTTYGDGATSETATVSLTSASATEFDVRNLVPGDSMTRCVDVTYSGSAKGDQLSSIQMMVSGESTPSLADHLTIQGQMGVTGGIWPRALWRRRRL